MTDTQIDLHMLLGFLRRRFKLIAATVLAVMLIVGVVTFSLTPIYSATTLVMVDPNQQNLLNPQPQFAPSFSENARIDSEVALTVSDANLLSVISQEGLLDDEEFGIQLGLRDRLMALLRVSEARLPTGREAVGAVLTKLRSAIRANRVSTTFLIAIEARSRSPERAAELANIVAQTYIRTQLEAKIDSTLQARDVLEGRISAASAAVAESERAFDTFIEGNFEIIVRETGRSDLAQLRRDILLGEQTGQRLAETLEQVGRSLERQDWETLAQALETEAVRVLAEQRSEIEAAMVRPETNEQMRINLAAELATINRQLSEAGERELTSLRQRVAQAQGSVTDLRRDLRSEVLQTDMPVDMLARIYEIQQTAELSRAQYQSLLARLMEIDTQASLQIADSRVVSEATPPSRPAFPNALLFFALGGMGSLALGVGLAFLYENYVGGITHTGQFEAVLGVPLVATIARQRVPRESGRGGPSGVADLIVSTPLSAFAESVRSLKAAIDQLWRRHNPGGAFPPGPVIMVTSTNPAEGKSTLALSIARAYALSGVQTVLVDCDLRKPSLHLQLARPPSSRLAEYLSRTGELPDFAELVETDARSPLHLVLGGRRSDLPTDQLVSGPAFSRMIERLTTSYAAVILDTPPAAAVVDSMYIAELADFVAFVVQAGVTPQREARDAVAKIEASLRPEAALLGVLNGHEGDRLDAGQRYAGYYQAY